MSGPTRSGLSLFAAIGLVMSGLQLKRNLDEYKPVSSEDGEAQIGLLDTATRPKRKRPGCCICCGINCTLFWKVVAVVLGFFALWNIFRLIRWAVAKPPTGLELMPTYSSSFGCISVPHSSETTFTARIGPQEFDHSFDIRGGAVGSFVIAQGPIESQEVKYEMTIRSDNSALLQDISVHHPDVDENGSVTHSRTMISTPYTDPSSSSCIRYDIKMYVPPNLKKLNVAAHAPMHLQFDSASNIDLDDLLVTMFAMNKNNMVLPHKSVRANRMTLEAYSGWIVGDVMVVNNTSITTQRGDGVVNLRAHPTAPSNLDSPEPASLRTTTGAGRSDISYVNPKAFKRPIHNVHISSRNADVYLNYRDAEYSGRIELESASYTATGAHTFAKVPPASGDQNPKWTHWVGDQDGSDTIYIKSRGWTGLYF